MSMMSALVSFALVAGLLTIIPGLDTALVLRATVTGGRRSGVAAALGVQCGTLIWGAGAAAGITALLTASRLAYTGLRIAGAVYMIYLGAALLRTAWHRWRGVDATEAQLPSTPSTPIRSFTRGLMTNLLNPKVGVFYVAVLPQFLAPGVPVLVMGVLLAAVHCLEGMVWFTGIIAAVQLFRRWTGKKAVTTTLDATTGAVLVGFGVKLALERT